MGEHGHVRILMARMMRFVISASVKVKAECTEATT